MKKLGLIIALVLLFSAVSDGAVPSDGEFRRGLKLYNSKNYKAAVKQLQEYVDKKPDPTAFYLIGYSLYKLGKFSEADEYFSQAYLIDPEFSLEKVGLIDKTSREIVQKKPAAVPETKITEPDASQPKSPEKGPQQSRPAPAVHVEQKEKGSGTAAPATAPKAAAAKQPPPAPIPAPLAPAAKSSPIPKQRSGASSPLPVGIMAAVGACFFLVMAIGLYIFKKRKDKGSL
jgi:tetratricopeptide (TPR) repeat protein